MVKGTVIATDLDGTLFYPKKRVSMLTKKTKKFIDRFLDDGGRLLLVSSRNHHMTAKVEKKIGRPIDTVGCNGTFVISDGKTIKEDFFDRDYLKSIIDCYRAEYDPQLILLSSKDRNLVITRTNVSKMTNFMYFVYEMSQGVYRDPFVRSDHVFYQEVEKGQVYKIMMLVGLTKKKKSRSQEIAKAMQEKFPQANFVSIGEFIEITPVNSDKSKGIAFYLDYNGISKDNVLVIGDSGNDVPMFECFQTRSYAMEHGPAWVKAKASHVIKRFSDLEKVLYPSEDSK